MELGCDGQLFDIISGGQTLSEETTSFVIGNLLDAVRLMHKNKILHRDIKPENIVLVHVSAILFRGISNYVILGGQSIKSNSSEAPFVGHHCICRLNCCRAQDMIKK
jgi:serine/threonine protein kinase